MFRLVYLAGETDPLLGVGHRLPPVVSEHDLDHARDSGVGNEGSGSLHVVVQTLVSRQALGGRLSGSFPCGEGEAIAGTGLVDVDLTFLYGNIAAEPRMSGRWEIRAETRTKEVKRTKLIIARLTQAPA